MQTDRQSWRGQGREGESKGQIDRETDVVRERERGGNKRERDRERRTNRQRGRQTNIQMERPREGLREDRKERDRG